MELVRKDITQQYAIRYDIHGLTRVTRLKPQMNNRKRVAYDFGMDGCGFRMGRVMIVNFQPVVCLFLANVRGSRIETWIVCPAAPRLVFVCRLSRVVSC